ncbi:unnamed protein product [uncultured bacterium]|nr:unnamed protein product [uncultured bacterium]
MTTLPEGLRQQFQALETRLWRTDTAVAICGSAVALLGAFGLQFVSDRVWDTPGWLRVLLMASALGVMAACLVYYGRRWIWGHRSLETMAAIVQKRYRRLGDRLLGIVELADETRRPQNVSPALCAAAIRQVAGEAAAVNFTDAVETRKSTRLKTAFVVLGIVIATPWLVAPEACWNALSRLLQPAGGLHRYTFVSLDQLPDSLVVPHGEPFQIDVGISERRFLNPTRATARFERQPVIYAPIANGAIRFQVPGQTNEGVLRVEVGDASREVRILPTYRPELRELSAQIEYPAYLRYPESLLPVKSASLALVEGSRAAFHGQVSRNLRGAEATLAGDRSENVAATVRGPDFETAPIPFKEGMNDSVRIDWMDESGLKPALPWNLKLECRLDAPPVVAVSDLAAAVAILETETLKVSSTASDDFGVRDLTMVWEMERAGNGETPGDQRIARGEPQAHELKGAWEFNPAKLGIHGDSVVLLRATARDYLPTREPASSGAYRVYVLGPDSHAKLVHDELDKLLAKLDDIARLQEELLEKGKGLDPTDPAAAAKLREQSEEQQRLAEELEELAKKAAETVEEGMRNQEINPSTLNRWAEQIQAMKEIAGGGMPQASQELADAEKADPRAAELKQALGSEQKVLEALRDLQKRAMETQDTLAQETIALRLRKLGDRHGEAAKSLLKLLPETAGIPEPDLPAAQRERVTRLAADQETRRLDAAAVHGEIQRFFDRSKLNRYGEVSKAMDDGAMDDKLKALQQLIAQNTAATGIEQARFWEGQFHEWAERISANDPSKSQQPSQSGEPTPEQMKMMFDLIRLRQREVALRTRTGTLEQGKTQGDSYLAGTAEAATEQRAMIPVATEIGANPAFCPGPQAMRVVTGAMDDAAKQLEIPRTDQPAVEAETDVINLLNHLLESHCNSCGMKAMRAMMGMGTGKGGSGSMAGGATDRSNDPVRGPVKSDPGESRAPQKVVGADPSRAPAEFREALQSYYQSVEKELR